MSTSTNVNQYESEKSINITKYQGIIGYLLYLTTSILDIIFIVYLCARYQ